MDIPGQVQVIGYDGIADYATGRYPCSTIEQPLTQMAEAAVEILLDPDRSAAESVKLPVRYIPGGTTREPAHTDVSATARALRAMTSSKENTHT